MADAVQVPDDIRLRLAHGVLQLLAEGAGVRVLHVKGVALDPELARDRAPSTDCDLLVEPGRADRFAEVLAGAGWEPVTSFEGGSVFGHAAAFHHPVWGTVDLHRAFPGLDADVARSFTAFWTGRTEVLLGSTACAAPSADLQRLLLLVHAARDDGGRTRHDVRVAWTERDATERARLDALAEELGGTVPLALVTDRPERAEGGRDEHLWRALHAGADPTTVWRARLRDARGLRGRARILRGALQVNPDHLGLRLGRAPTRTELRREWLARWGRAARSLGGTLRRRRGR